MPQNPASDPVTDYRFGPYRFDGRLRRLYKGEEPVVLTPRLVDTLAALLERAGSVVEKDDLLRAVWGDVVVGEDSLAQNISTLRRVLGDDRNRPRFIATAPRRGYRFVAHVEVVPPDDAGRMAGGPPRARRVHGPIVALLAATAVVAAGGTLAIRWLPVERPPRASVQFTIPEPESGRFSSTGGMLAISPDGSYVTLVVVDPAGTPSIWLRPLAATVARPLAGTEGAAQPFWSPDSRTLAFFADRRLKAVDVGTGTVRVIASLGSSRSMGGTWSRRGQILFSVPNEGLYLVAASGGSPERLDPTLGATCGNCATWPYFLPDGRHFLYTVAHSETSQPGIYVGELRKPGGRRLVDAVSSSAYVAPGYLSYARSGTLYMQRFDADRLRVSGVPAPVMDGVAYNARTGRVLAAVSDVGVLAFRRPLTTELVWVDRAGAPQGRAAPPGTYMDFSIAPDGRRVAAARVDPRTGTSDIWVFDGEREVRVTDDANSDGDPVWSEDGRYVTYSSRRDGRWRIYRRQATAVGPEELVLDAHLPVTPLQTLRSRDLIYSISGASRPYDVFKLAQGEPTPVAHVGGFYPNDARLSPDERWLVYGRPETAVGLPSQTMYVVGVPAGGARRAIAEAASTPRWRADGRELFYLSKDSTIVAVPVDPGGTPNDAAGGPLFRATDLAPTGISGEIYDVAPDGRRFLVKREVGASLVHVVLNWEP